MTGKREIRRFLDVFLTKTRDDRDKKGEGDDRARERRLRSKDVLIKRTENLECLYKKRAENDGGLHRKRQLEYEK